MKKIILLLCCLATTAFSQLAPSTEHNMFQPVTSFGSTDSIRVMGSGGTISNTISAPNFGSAILQFLSGTASNLTSGYTNDPTVMRGGGTNNQVLFTAPSPTWNCSNGTMPNQVYSGNNSVMTGLLTDARAGINHPTFSTLAANATVASGVTHVIITATANTTITLQTSAVVGAATQKTVILNQGVSGVCGTVTVAAQGADTINGAATYTIPATAGYSTTFTTDGSGVWWAFSSPLAYLWNTNSSGNWATASNWINNSPPNYSGASAFFNYPLTSAQTVTVDKPITLKSIILSNTGVYGYTLSTTSNPISIANGGSIWQTPACGNHTDIIGGGIGSIILLGQSGTQTFTCDAPGASGRIGVNSAVSTTSTGSNYNTLILNGTNTLISYVGALNGNIAVVKNGIGTWGSFGGGNFTGGLTINSGTMRWVTGGNNPFGSGTTTVNGGGLIAMSITGGTCSIDNMFMLNAPLYISQIGASGSNQLTLSGRIAGGNGINFTGSNVLTLALTGTNTFSGGVTINSGTVNMYGLLGSGVYSGAIVNNGYLLLSPTSAQSLSSGISGSGVLTTANSVTISGNNSYTGGTVVTNGSLTIASATALGTSGTTTVTGSYGSASLYMNGPINITGQTMVLNPTTAGGASLYGPSTAQSWSGPINLTGSGNWATLYSIANTFTLSGSISGALTGGQSLAIRGSTNGAITNTISIGATNLLKRDTGTWTLSGTSNTWLNTNINAGSIILGATNVLPSTTIVTIGQAAGSATLDLGGFAQTVGGINDTATETSATITSTNPAILTVTNTSPCSYGSNNGIISGAISLTKNGSSSLALGGNSSYTGATNINSGTLQLTGTGAFGATSLLNIYNCILDLNGQNYTQVVGLVNNNVISTGTVTNTSTNLATFATGLQCTGSASITGTNPITLTGNWTVGTPSATTGLWLNGTNTVTLTNTLNNNTALPVAISSGSLVLNSSLPQGAIRGQMNNYCIQMFGGNVSLAHNDQIRASTADILTGLVGVFNGTFDCKSFNTTCNGIQLGGSGGTQLGSGLITDTVGGGYITISGSTTIGSNPMLLYSGTNNASIRGTGVVAQKLLSGTVTLNGASTYTGTTSISGGNVIVGSSNAFGTSTVNISGSAIQTLINGSYIIPNNINVANAVTGLGVNGVITASDSTNTSLTGTFSTNGNTIAGGHLAGPTTTGTLTVGPIVVNTSYCNIRVGNVAINGPITNGTSTGSLALSAGILTLNGSNSYTGGTSIGSSGTAIVTYMNVNAFGTGNIGLNAAPIYNGLVAGCGGTLPNTISASGAFSLTSNTNTVVTLGGNITGVASLYMNGTNNIWLSGNNTFSGGTFPQGNSVLIAASNTAFGTGTCNISAGSAVGLTAGVTSTNTAILSGPGVTSFGSVTAEGGNSTWSGPISMTGTTNRVGATTGTMTISGTISGGATNSLIIRTNASNTQVNLTGSSTYTGTTSIYTQGGVVAVNGFNSVVGGKSGSALGAPTTVANGTIYLGISVDGYLQYTGTGETTDRVICLNATQTNINQTLDQSGSGLLKFTSNFTSTDAGAGTKYLVLTGTGLGEIDGVIPDATTTTTTVQKYGSGTWTMGGTNTYTAGTTFNSGTLAWTTNLNPFGTGNMTIAGASTVLVYTGTGTTTVASRIVANNDFLITSPNSYNINLSAGMNLGGVSRTVTTNLIGSTTVGVVSVGNLIKSGTGSMYLVGANTYTDTTITQGNLYFGNGGATGVIGSGSLTISSGANAAMQNTTGATWSMPISGGGGVVGKSGTLTLPASSSFTGILAVSAGSGNAACVNLTGTTTAGVNITSGTFMGTGKAVSCSIPNATTSILMGGTGITSPGNFTVTGNLTFLGSSSQLNVGSNGTTTLSTITVGGTTALGGCTVNLLNTMSTGVYNIIIGTGVMSGTLPVLGTNSSGHTAVFSQSGNNLVLTLS